MAAVPPNSVATKTGTTYYPVPELGLLVPIPPPSRHFLSLQKNSTDPVLTSLLLIGLKSWHDGTPTEPAGYPRPYRKLIRQQNRLLVGVNCLMAARRHSGLAFKTIKLALNGPRKLLLLLWDNWEIAHGLDHARSVVLKQRALNELRDIYADKTNYVPCDHRYLMKHFQSHSTQPVPSIISWLTHYRPVFKRSCKLAVTHAIRNVQPLTAYFPKVHQIPLERSPSNQTSLGTNTSQPT